VLVTARTDGRLVGLGNPISDGHLLVYNPHFLVHPEFQRQGVGRAMMKVLVQKYAGFHRQMLTADGNAFEFYEAMGPSVPEERSRCGCTREMITELDVPPAPHRSADRMPHRMRRSVTEHVRHRDSS